MNICDVCYEEYEEDPYVIGWAIGKTHKVPFFMDLCPKCKKQHQKVYNTGLTRWATNPFQKVLETAVQTKIAVSKKSII